MGVPHDSETLEPANAKGSPRYFLSRFYRQRGIFHEDQSYLIGLRGLLVIETFLWVFLSTFAPAAVKDSGNRTGPAYQLILRDIFSVPFWNADLIYSLTILLSARSICIPFLHDPSRATVASSIFRRGLRLWWPVCASLAIVMVTFSQLGSEYVQSFKDLTGNDTVQVPYQIPNALAYWNSVFNIFWTTRDFASQAGNAAFPSMTLWTINVIYSQSFTVFLTMVIIPYTRPSWRIKAGAAFIFLAWWVQSWAWYSISGLALADMVMNMDLKRRLQRGIPLWHTSARLPAWIPAALLAFAGLAMQYLWTDALPGTEDAELVVHTGLYTSGGLNHAYVSSEPQARDDVYLIMMGFLLLIEQFDMLQSLFSNPLFMFLGRRSLSYFLTQSIVCYTAGIKLALHLQGTLVWSAGASNLICFIVCMPLTVLTAEAFYHVVDHPAHVFAYGLFDWMRK